MTVMSVQIAVISDIHGNIWALREVLADINARGIERIVNLGDSLYGPLAPVETAELLIIKGILSVCGNEDRNLIEETDRADISETLRYVRDVLGAEHFHWLKSLPFSTTAYNEFFLCHGTPMRDDEYLFWNILRNGKARKSERELLDMLQSIDEPIVLCGHDHTPNTVRLSETNIIVNPGSVGLQAYTDDTPYPHFMETGDPRARYSIISRNKSGWIVENIAIDYDWESAARTAEKNNRPDWARWLRTGRADG